MTMTPDELRTLHTYIDTSRHYLEFGMGESTVYAATSPHLETIDSVESSEEYYNQHLKPNAEICRALSADKLSIHFINLGDTINWGYPKDKSKKHLWPSYSLSIFAKKNKFDLVLIDGRFRVACALSAALNLSDDCTILIHDFWNRSKYHIVLNFLEVVDRVDTFGVFRKKNIKPSKLQSLLRRYQYQPK